MKLKVGKYITADSPLIVDIKQVWEMKDPSQVRVRLHLLDPYGLPIDQEQIYVLDYHNIEHWEAITLN